VTKDAVDGLEPALEGEVRLPRMQQGQRPQHLLVTLLGDYWFGRSEHLPSAALVALLGEFGITQVAARAALSRLARRGLLDTSKEGRRTYYALTARASAVLGDGVQRIMSFGTGTRKWDGVWRVAVFSVSEDRRDLRHAARSRLRWLGFAPLYDGVWVSPHDVAAEAASTLADLGIANYSVLAASVPPGIPQGLNPLAAWDLEELRAGYDRFVAEREGLLERALSGTITVAEALVCRTEIMDTWRHFPNLDPELPTELLPADWPLKRAHDLFAQLYDHLGPLAEIRVRQIVSRFSADLGGLVRHHTTRSVLARSDHG